MLEEVLSFEGYTLLKANNGRSAFEIIDSHGQIDVVISDVQMPGGDGIELMKKMEGIASHCRPGLILTTGSVANHSEKIATYPILGIFEKPIDYERLIKTIESFEILRPIKNLEEEIVSF